MEGVKVAAHEVALALQPLALFLPPLCHLDFGPYLLEVSLDLSTNAVGFLQLALHLADLLLEGGVLACQKCQGAVDVLHRILGQRYGLGI